MLNIYCIVLQPLSGNSSRGINANPTKDPLAIPVDPQILVVSPSSLIPTQEDSKWAPSISATPQSSTYLTNHDDSDEDTSDPDLMPLSVEDLENAMHLLDIVMTSTDAVDSATDGDADIDLLDILDEALQRFDEADPIHSCPEGFIDYFSRINIMRNQIAGRLSEDKFQENVYKWAPTGNSRDTPARFIYRCSNRIWGCEHIGYERKAVEEHSRKCRISQSNPVKPANIMCRKPNCSKGFRTKSARESHEQAHGFERRQCDLCHDGKWYESVRQWNNHKSTYHSNEWDPGTICGVQDCPRGEVPFKTRSSYQQHLRGTHKLSGPDVAQYVPVSAHRAFTWGKRVCPFDGCSRETTKKQHMETHLKGAKKGGHHLSDEEVARKMEEIMAG